jgi:hypothetical protein
MSFIVQRLRTSATTVMGQLIVDGAHFCYTLEPNPPIPAGTYDLIIDQSVRFGRRMPHVLNVPGYTGIRLHWGNWRKDTEGCTLTGTTEAIDFVGHSVEAFNELFREIEDHLKDGPQTISYVDQSGSAPDVDGEIAA